MVVGNAAAASENCADEHGLLRGMLWVTTSALATAVFCASRNLRVASLKSYSVARDCRNLVSILVPRASCTSRNIMVILLCQFIHPLAGTFCRIDFHLRDTVNRIIHESVMNRFVIFSMAFLNDCQTRKYSSCASPGP